MNSDREQAINSLIAKQAITEALYRYCRGEDRIDGKLSASAWHPDGTATYGYEGELFDGTVGDYIQYSHRALARFTGTSHQISNVLIEVEGNLAASEAYVTARMWNIANGDQILHRVAIGRYLDRWSFRGGVWAIDHRDFVFDFFYSADSVEPPEEQEYMDRLPRFEGRHDSSDPSYRLLR